MLAKQVIIIGGGASIREGIEKELWTKIQSLFTLGLNYNYLDFRSTALVCVDPDFYDAQINDDTKDSTLHPSISRKAIIRDLPLVIGQSYLIPTKLDNTLLLKASASYRRDLSSGVYSPALCGLWALSLAIYLLDIGEIFLLGYDFGETRSKDFHKIVLDKKELDALTIKENKKALTHYYQGKRRDHRGTGKIDWFNQIDSKSGKTRVERVFEPYLAETKCKIYNVSMISKIKAFPQITYDEFFTRISKETLDQSALQSEIRSKLLALPR